MSSILSFEHAFDLKKGKHYQQFVLLEIGIYQEHKEHNYTYPITLTLKYSKKIDHLYTLEDFFSNFDILPKTIVDHGIVYTCTLTFEKYEIVDYDLIVHYTGHANKKD